MPEMVYGRIFRAGSPPRLLKGRGRTLSRQDRRRGRAEVELAQADDALDHQKEDKTAQTLQGFSALGGLDATGVLLPSTGGRTGEAGQGTPGKGRRAGEAGGSAAQFRPESRPRAITWAWISAAPSKMLRMRASHSTREMRYSSA